MLHVACCFQLMIRPVPLGAWYIVLSSKNFGWTLIGSQTNKYGLYPDAI